MSGPLFPDPGSAGFVAGIDLGVRSCTFCLLSVGEGIESPERSFAIFRRWESKLAGPEAVRELALAMPVALGILFPLIRLAWIERPMGRHIRSVSDLARAGGAIAAHLPLECGLDEIDAPNWKKAIGLNGNCPKSVVQAWARERLGQDLSEHEADAYAIAQVALRVSYGAAI